jgi:hypothetical protein
MFLTLKWEGGFIVITSISIFFSIYTYFVKYLNGYSFSFKVIFFSLYYFIKNIIIFL